MPKAHRNGVEATLARRVRQLVYTSRDGSPFLARLSNTRVAQMAGTSAVSRKPAGESGEAKLVTHWRGMPTGTWFLLLLLCQRMGPAPCELHEGGVGPHGFALLPGRLRMYLSVTAIAIKDPGLTLVM